MLAIIGASGKLGGATLSALLSYTLAEPSSIVGITSSQPGSETWSSLESKGVNVRHGTFDDGSTLRTALQGCTKLFLVSTPRIAMDFNDAPEGQGREKHHKVAIDAARNAGVNHIYYSSLGFGNPSKAGVMRAHIRTEAYLASLKDTKVTVIREGLYNESWPLYLGYYDQKHDERGTVPLAGDGKISWTAIEDLGLGNALVLTAPSEEYDGKTFYLSNPPETAKTMKEVAELVAKARGKEVKVEIVDRKGHEDFYIQKKKMDAPAVRWWSSTYEVLEDGECLIDDPTLSNLLQSKGKKAKSMEETVEAMIRG
ncbi:NmrA-like family protein [Seiridium cupressi]